MIIGIKTVPDSLRDQPKSKPSTKIGVKLYISKCSVENTTELIRIVHLPQYFNTMSNKKPRNKISSKIGKKITNSNIVFKGVS